MIEEYSENPNQSAWVMAHAGSGKTYALVRRVMALLLQGCTPQTIWCLTYTNNAASEMQERLLVKLKEFNGLPDETLPEALAEYLGYPVQTDSVARLRQLARDMAMPGGGITCTTMHGLCQQLLRVFALEVGLLPDFGILTETEARLLVNASVEAVFSQAVQVQSGPLYEALQAVSTRAGYDLAVQRLRKMLTKAADVQAAIVAEGSLEALVDGLYHQHQLQKKETLHERLQHIHAATLPAMAHIAPAMAVSGKTDQDRAQAIRGWLDVDVMHETKLQQAWQRYGTVFFDSKDQPRAPEKLYTKKSGITDGSSLGDAFAREQMRVIAAREALANAVLLEDSEAMLVLLLAVLDHYAAAKAEMGVLDFDDLLAHIARLLENQESIGHVMRRLDYRVEHILLDEAQDTSPQQWQILSSLVEELCATAPRHAPVPRSVFVVGDVKQSIYSFQGAAPEMMAEKHQYFQDLYAAHGLNFRTGALSKARRSAADILAFVDKMAALPETQAGLMEEAITHHALRKDAPATIGLFPLIEADAQEKPTGFHMPLHYHESAKAHHKLAEAITQQVQVLLNGQTRLEETGQWVRPGDIMIIVRNRGKLVPALIRAFEKAHIPVEGADRLLLAEHVMVKDILALIRFLYQEKDDLSLARVLRSPLIGVDEQALFTLAHAREGSLFEALKQAPAHAEHCAWLQQQMARKNHAAYSWLHYLFYHCGARAAYQQRLGQEVTEVVDLLLDYAQSQHGKPEASLLYFLRQMERAEHVVQQPASHMGQSVRILTVHGAKGLEAPVVILADTTSTPQVHREEVYEMPLFKGKMLLCPLREMGKQSALLADAKQKISTRLDGEYYRALYVALTRARDMLFIFGTKPKTHSQSHWHAVLTQAMRAMPNMEETEAGVLWCSQMAHSQLSDGEGVVANAPTIPVPDWLQAPLPEVARLPVLTPSAVGGVDKDGGRPNVAPGVGQSFIKPHARPENAQHYGIALHALLQWVTLDTPEELWRKALTQEGLSDADCALAVSQIRALFQNETLADLWKKPALCEREIACELNLQGQAFRLVGVIDRIIQTETEWMIVDYKTTQSPPEEGQVPYAYRLQLSLYQQALAEIYPDIPTRLAILWTANARLDIVAPLPVSSMAQQVTRNLSVSRGLMLDELPPAA